MRCAPLVLDPQQRLATVHRDRCAKRDLCYLIVDRTHEWAILSQSLPLLAQWMNDNLSSGEAWDRVSVTGLFECLNRTTGRNGGWHKGRFRIRTVPLETSCDAFEAVRASHAKAVVVAGAPQRYTTTWT